MVTSADKDSREPKEAMEMGLVNKVVPLAKLMDEASASKRTHVKTCGSIEGCQVNAE